MCVEGVVKVLILAALVTGMSGLLEAKDQSVNASDTADTRLSKQYVCFNSQEICL